MTDHPNVCRTRQPLGFPATDALQIGQDRMRFLFTMLDNPQGFFEKKSSAKLSYLKDDKAGISRLVEPDGIEPTTSCLQSTRSPN